MAILMVDQNDQLHAPCKFSINENEFLQITPGDFIEDITNNQGTNIRNIDWTSSVSLTAQAKIKSDQLNLQSWAIGHHNVDQVNFLKSQWPTEAVTIGILYGRSDYHWLLDNLARYHIFLLNTHQLPITDDDREILDNLTYDNQVSCYTKKFDQCNLIPKEYTDEVFDINVWVSESLDFNRLQLHFSKLGITLKQSTTDYFNLFINLHKERKYKIMETFNRIQKMLATQVGVDSSTITRDTSFEEINLDSLDIVEIIMDIETKFQIELEDKDYQTLTSVGELIELIDTKLREKTN